MIIPNPVIKLDYNPVTDVLSVKWPDFSFFSVSEAKYSLGSITQAIRNYDVKYLLADTTTSTVAVSEQKYYELVGSFAESLAKTRVKKIARIVTEATAREEQIREISTKANLQVPIKAFYTREEALKWLTSND